MAHFFENFNILNVDITNIYFSFILYYIIDEVKLKNLKVKWLNNFSRFIAGQCGHKCRNMTPISLNYRTPGYRPIN
jgi:hypothetical protein